ncbi:hypothetical protein ACLB90_14270 [Stenotrophomonas sp. LGBM10]|uniref:hypothetical protein n=1 Tax=Stenotrophomonas sp. LGBM10 TaxID=3390038 RepID=UPI00398B6AD5
MTRMIPRYALVLACAVGMAACTQPAAPDAPVASGAPAPEASTPQADATPAPNAAVTHTTPGQAQPPRACMIAGEFTLFGKTIRSRDCVQSSGASSEAELKKICEGLASTSAQMGGKAGQVSYMDACPSPSQGSCTGLFGLAFDGYYYERAADDLAGLPDSCTQGGGRWTAG